MADSGINISAFLELHDKMSGGINTATSELEKLTDASNKVTSATDILAGHHETATSTIVSGLDSQTKGFNQATEAAEAANEAMQGASEETEAGGESMFEAVVAGTALVDILKGVGTAAIDAAKQFASMAIELNRTFENTALRIAGTLVAFDVAPNIKEAQQESQKLLGYLQDIAAVKIGETSDYIEVFSQALPKALESGMQDMKKIAEFTSLYTAVALTNTVDAAQAGRDLYMILAGQAGAEQRMWQVLGTQIGMAATEFNQLTAPERLSLVTQVLEKQAESVAAAASTYDAVYGEYQSLTAEITRLSGKESFEEMKDVYAEINTYLKNNKEELIGLGKILMGGTVVGAKILAGWFLIIEKIAVGISTVFDFIGKKARELNSLAGSLFYDIENLVGKTNEATEAQLKLNDAKADGHREDIAYRRQLADVAKEYERNLAAASKLEEERQATKEQLWFPEIEKKMGLQGKEIMGKLAPHVRRLAELTKTQGYSKEQAMSFLEAKGADRAVAEEMWRATEASRKKDKAARSAVRKHKETTPKVIQDFRYSKFDIRQEFAEGFDPDRIATAFASDLGRLGEMKAAAVYAPLFSGG